MQSERSLIPTPMPVRRHARSGNRGLALTALCLAVLLVVMDNTIVNVAIPTMSDALNASSTDLQWVVDAYTLSFAALLLPAGKLSDHGEEDGCCSSDWRDSPWSPQLRPSPGPCGSW